ncbi:hypothetical protein FSO04_24285 [Paraburkholderia madseniana]|uniref:Lipoprotein n=1 Tax=Paraburkholderia madseniana TaxID=2599607 RepID=A0A6N6WAY3_9BURK|nr:hypothetical protein [Paraburkholderia madseniana]KAE8757341.1 hypothetical protein FSO04_24285 [Paraburkholderia madseniana]
MKRMAMICATLALSGCATVHESYAPDGRKAYALNCSGWARGWDKCLRAAGNLCGAAGYTVVDRNEEDASSFGGGFSNGSGGYSGIQTKERTMMVECKPPG